MRTNIRNGQQQPNGKTAALPTDITYDVDYFWGYGKSSIAAASPAQPRHDCLVFPSEAGHPVALHWFGDRCVFTVIEVPVTENC
jgi:hypothetical protein